MFKVVLGIVMYIITLKVEKKVLNASSVERLY